MLIEKTQWWLVVAYGVFIQNYFLVIFVSMGLYVDSQHIS